MGQEATPPGSRGQLFFALIWLLTTALLVTAFQTIGISEALGDEVTDPADAVAPDFSLTAPDPAEHPFPTVLYGGMLWSVLDVRVTPVEAFLGRAVIDVDLELTNSLSSTRLRVSERELKLIDDDDLVLPQGRFVDVDPRLTIDPGETFALTFRVQTGHDREPDPEDLTLVIGESDRIPELIQLEGDEPAHDAPIPLAVEATPAPMADPDDTTRQIVVELVGASIGINAGPYRAGIDERLAVVKVKIQRASPSETSGFLDVGFWSMSADDAEVAPILVTRTAQVDGNADEVTLLFAFPAYATSFELDAGAGSPSPRSFALVLPSGT